MARREWKNRKGKGLDRYRDQFGNLYVLTPDPIELEEIGTPTDEDNLNGMEDDIESSHNLAQEAHDKIEQIDIKEAPIDGRQYGRQDAKWTEIVGGGSGEVEEAPDDGEIYGRRSKAWQRTITEQRMTDTEEFTQHLSIRISDTDNKAENANREIHNTNRNLERTNQNVENLSNEVATKIDEAPADDILYGRKNNDWEEIETGTIYEAPNNGASYTRTSKGWEAFATRDGIRWGIMPSISKNAWEKVIHIMPFTWGGNSYYMAVASAGDDPRMMIGFHSHVRAGSEDDASGDIEWHFIDEAPVDELYSIASGWDKTNWNNVLIAVGKDCIYRNMWGSPHNWEKIDDAPAGDLKDIVAVGEFDNSPSPIRYDDNTDEQMFSYYYVVGKDKVILSEDNTETWEEIDDVPNGDWKSLVYRKIGKLEVLVAVGDDKIMQSSNTIGELGHKWKLIEQNKMPAGLELNDVACDGYMFVAVGKGRIVYSTNVADWQEAMRILDKNWVSVTHGNGMWVAVSDKGDVITSFDGKTWTTRQSDTGDELSSICSGNFAYLAVSRSATLNRIISSIGHASDTFVSALYSVLAIERRPIYYSRGLHSIGEWIDNEPIMECIFEGKTNKTAGELATIGTIKHGVDALVEVAGYIDGKDGLKIPLGHDNIRIIDGKNVCIATNNADVDLTNCDVTAVIRYTVGKQDNQQPDPKPAPTTLYLNPDNTIGTERIIAEKLIEVSENNASNITITFYDDKGKEIGKTTEQVISHGWKDFNAKIKSNTIASVKLETEESVAEFIADEPFVYNKKENDVRAELFLTRNSKDPYAETMLYITFGNEKVSNKLSIQ